MQAPLEKGQAPSIMSNAQPSSDQPPLWREVRRVLRGGFKDYTQGSMARAILLLAIPMVLEMLMQSVFELVDAY